MKKSNPLLIYPIHSKPTIVQKKGMLDLGSDEKSSNRCPRAGKEERPHGHRRLPEAGRRHIPQAGMFSVSSTASPRFALRPEIGDVDRALGREQGQTLWSCSTFSEGVENLRRRQELVQGNGHDVRPRPEARVPAGLPAVGVAGTATAVAYPYDMRPRIKRKQRHHRRHEADPRRQLKCTSPKRKTVEGDSFDDLERAPTGIHSGPPARTDGQEIPLSPRPAGNISSRLGRHDGVFLGWSRRN